MGFSICFRTSGRKTITLAEVMAGVQAIKMVAERRRHEFVIQLLEETAIAVNVRSDRPVESFVFRPKLVKEGVFLLPFTSCKTNAEPETEGIKEMLEALQTALGGKLHIT